ncbi:MAG: YHS domain-containing protein [Saprospiraceae bacterium]|nr:YHS domain-containing protein [Saprospiraceae bacterium]
MKLKIPVIVTTVCILAMFSCLSKNEPATADTAARNPTAQDTLDKSRLHDTPAPENDAQGMNAPQHAAAIPPSADKPEKAKMPANQQHTTKSVAESKGKSAAFANTTDYICGMDVMPDYTDTCHLDGKVYAFCSEYCKDKFKENPNKYLGKK